MIEWYTTNIIILFLKLTRSQWIHRYVEINRKSILSSEVVSECGEAPYAHHTIEWDCERINLEERNRNIMTRSLFKQCVQLNRYILESIMLFQVVA